MAFKLFAAELAKKKELMKELIDGETAMQDAFTAAQKQINRAVSDFEDAVSDYEATRQKVEQFRSEIAERCRTEIDDKSEKWADSEAGASAENFTTQWEEDHFNDEMETVETVELQYEIPELSEPLSNLPDSAE